MFNRRNSVRADLPAATVVANPVRYLVGTGFNGQKPVGYQTIDIDPGNNPDIVADAASLPMIATETADEFYASHVLEHFSFPRVIHVLEEWARVLKPGGMLKVAVPDMEIYAHRILNSHDPWQTVHRLYGAHWAGEGGPQGHHFGYTRRMLVELLTVMGFSDFDFWRSEGLEAANTWEYGEGSVERVGVSLNLAGIKRRAPLFPAEQLFHRIRHIDMALPFPVIVRNMLTEQGRMAELPETDAVLFQRLNHRFLQAAHEAKHWETEYYKLAEKLSNVGPKNG